MLTALDDQKSIDEAYFSGATDFITKPLNMPLLPHRVRHQLRSAMTFQQLMMSRETLLNTQKLAGLGDWTLDGDGGLRDCSEQFRALLGIGRPPRPAASLLTRVHPADRARVEAARAGLSRGHAFEIEYRLTRADGRLTHLHEVGYPNPPGAEGGGYGYTQDITKRVETEVQIRRLAWYDPLTGLLNRSRLFELLEDELAAGRALALCFIQLSGLHRFSLLYGQLCADSALGAFVGRLDCWLAEQAIGGVAVAELGWRLARYDEASFVLTLTGELTRDALAGFAEALRLSVAAPLSVTVGEAAEEINLVPAIGVSRAPADAVEVQELMRCAMRCATRATAESCIRAVFFDPAYDAELSARHALERQLRIAIDNGDQLQLYFQPKVDADHGLVVGAEVLLRWRHPERGMVSPGEFIPLAERSGLIRPMTDWLLGEAAEQIARWNAAGLLPGRVSVNVSAHSFYGGGLVRLMDDTLARTGVTGEQLIVEITEGTLMHDNVTALQVLDALRARHIGISLDDFGTGYSSLGYLQRFPIDEIKIDRSFVIDLDSKASNQALVRAIVTLASALGLSVVAEGVETECQAAHLRRLGCHVLQGFLFGRPMPAADFAACLAQPLRSVSGP